MPDPPPVNLFTRYVLENPWPLGLVLLGAGFVIGYLALRQGFMRRLAIAASMAALGALVIITAAFVTTAGERAEQVTRQLVEAATTNDLVTSANLIDPDATLHISSAQNPGLAYDTIIDRISELAASYAIEENDITHLAGYTESRDAATVQLACNTTVASFPYPNLSQWELRVQRGTDGAWRVTKITWLTINTRTPPSSGW